jgi:hypothetical protein
VSGPRIPRTTRCGPAFTLPNWLRRLFGIAHIRTLSARARQLERAVDDASLHMVELSVDVPTYRAMLSEVRREIAAERAALEALK